MIVAERDKRIDELDRIANPHRYCLTSGAELVHYFMPNILNPSLHIWTKVGDVEYDTTKFSIDYNLTQQFAIGHITLYELVNSVFTPDEQINDAQRAFLLAAFEVMSGGAASPHVGTGSGGDTSNQSRWDGSSFEERLRSKNRPADFTAGSGRKRQ